MGDDSGALEIDRLSLALLDDEKRDFDIDHRTKERYRTDFEEDVGIRAYEQGIHLHNEGDHVGALESFYLANKFFERLKKLGYTDWRLSSHQDNCNKWIQEEEEYANKHHLEQRVLRDNDEREQRRQMKSGWIGRKISGLFDTLDRRVLEREINKVRKSRAISPVLILAGLILFFFISIDDTITGNITSVSLSRNDLGMKLFILLSLVVLIFFHFKYRD